MRRWKAGVLVMSLSNPESTPEAGLLNPSVVTQERAAEAGPRCPSMKGRVCLHDFKNCLNAAIPGANFQ
jgi:hypothetical protein